MPACEDMQSGRCADGIVACQSGEHDWQVGASTKTLERLMQITETGHLPAGAQICDIGATQLFGPFAFAGEQIDYREEPEAPTESSRFRHVLKKLSS